MKKQLLPEKTVKEDANYSKPESESIMLAPHPETTCEKVKAFRGDLIANVSHDLRTPLQCIIGFSETLLLKNENISAEDQKKYLDIILTNANKLSCMIEKFFEYSKLEISEINPERKHFSAQKIVDELHRNYKMLTCNKNITLDLNIEEELPNIYGDYLLIYRVFQNLIDNAIKFTPQNGTIKVNISKHSVCELQVQISDTGMGISYDKLDSVFNKFQTSKETTISGIENDGLGLGLAIVKKILSLHGSNIFVTSEIGQGTTFTFYLPLGT